jgi:DNA-binding beta-propeller fold protein YncE
MGSTREGSAGQVATIILFALVAVWSWAQATTEAKPSELPIGKTLAAAAGRVGPVNSLPVTIALSPDSRYAALLHAGFGTQSSRGCQSISIFTLANKKLVDFPDERLCSESRQSYFVGLAFSADGTHLYASLGSISDPTGQKSGNTGNAIAVYAFRDGKLSPERLIKIAPTKLASEKWVAKGLFRTPQGTAIPYPAGFAVINDGKGERLLIANNFSDSVILIDANSGELIHQFDLSTNTLVPSAYPYTVVVARNKRQAWCSLWNASRVVELDLDAGTIVRSIALKEPDSATAPGSHPTALLLNPDESRLYVALSNTDSVAAVSTKSGKVEAWLSTQLPEQKYPGTTPIALAQSDDGRSLFVATATLDAIAVFDTTQARHPGTSQWSAEGFIPTDWYPSALTLKGNQLLVATAKGTGTGPNKGPNLIGGGRHRHEHPYIPTLLNGSLAEVNLDQASKNPAALTQQVIESNRLKAELSTLPFTPGNNPIKHVIYVIKENRTYDQVFGDLKAGNGDPSLIMYGADITPNEHKLALQFGVLDNFYDSGEVSGDGHVWSTAAITSDYNEKTWQITYRGRERTYDFEGMVADEYPLERGIANVDSPQTGYLWANAAAHGLTYRDYGEFISTEFCFEPREPGQPAPKPPSPSETAPGAPCEHKVVKFGDPLPAIGDAKAVPSPYPWEIPTMKRSVPTMQELRGHTDLGFASFNVDYPDQLRADEFLHEFDSFVKARREGTGDELPNFVIMHLPNDHTGGTRPGKPTPAASVADNDLALGRIVDVVSHSPYWDDTAIFILEDDAQDGVDHVDAHRSLALVVSKYAPGSPEQPFVDHSFYTTVSMVHTMEALLGLPAMNLNDGYAPVLGKEFSGSGNQPPFSADMSNLQSRLIFKANPPAGAGAKQSARMDFSRPDAVNVRVLNLILWHDRKGRKPLPASKHTVIPADSRQDDD